jgi:hypothetical protein
MSKEQLPEGRKTQKKKYSQEKTNVLDCKKVTINCSPDKEISELSEHTNESIDRGVTQMKLEHTITRQSKNNSTGKESPNLPPAMAVAQSQTL